MSTIIQFKDINVKEALLASSDINSDSTREITYNEAKSSNITGAIIKTALNPDHTSSPNTDIVSFEEFRYFTGIDSFPDYLFANCTNLKKVIFPLITVANKQGYTLAGKSLLNSTSVEVLHLEGVDRLDAPSGYNVSADTSLFGTVSSLTEVWIPDVTVLSGNTFRKGLNDNIEKVVISSINQWVRMAVASLVNQKPNILPTSSGKASLYIGNTDEVNKVTSINIVLNDVVNDSIPDHCFDGILGLSTITITQSGTKVGAYAFANLPETVTIINYNNITALDLGVFDNCKAQGISGVPANIVTIGENVFRGSNIQACNSNTLLTIGRNAFYNSQIASVNIPNCTSINGSYGSDAYGVFAKCPNLITASINGVTSVPSSCFYDCSNLKTVEAYLATSVDKNSFYNCTQLISLYINVGITTFSEKACTNASKLDTIKTVDPSNNNAQANLDLATLTEVGVSAFEGCVLIQCPSVFSNLTSIGRTAFGGCIAPTTGTYVTLSKNDSIVTFVPSVNLSDNYKSPFPTSVTTVYVPSNLVSDYQNDDNWSRTGLTFAAIV